MARIEKKIWASYYDLVASGQKTFELRLADWKCEPGDTLVLVEVDDKTKEPTGRILERIVGFVGNTKDFSFWPQEDVDKYGYQIISLTGKTNSVVNFYTPAFFALNNFSAHAVEYEGLLYPTSEHAYQAAKCLNPEGKEAIRAAASPLKTKALANKVYNEDRDTKWDDKKVAVMEDILRAKLAQHKEVREVLKKTDTKPIVEDSPTDYFWGEGADGSGENMLGKLWMKIRDDNDA